MRASTAAPITRGDVSLLRAVARYEGSYFVTGYEKVRARRLVKAGLLKLALLGPEYVRLTDAGRRFLQRADRHGGAA